MSLTLGVYILGCILCAAFMIFFAVRDNKRLTLFDVIFALIISFSSWVGVFVSLLYESTEIVLWKSKDKK